MLADGFFNPARATKVRWGDLPHWRQDGALYFVTYRLADSLPQELLRRWREERDQWRRLFPEPTDEELIEFARRHRGKMERWLDRDSGSCVLRIPAARMIVEGSLRFFDGERYELGELAVSANHVHVTVRTLPGIDLSNVLHSWKRHASREILRIDGVVRRFPELRGHLWQQESFDHIVRDQSSLDRFHRYIRNHGNGAAKRSGRAF